MNEVGFDKMMQDDVCAAQCSSFVGQSILNNDPSLLSSRPEVPPFLIPPAERGLKYLEGIDLLPPPRSTRPRSHRNSKNKRRPFKQDLNFPDESIIV